VGDAAPIPYADPNVPDPQSLNTGLLGAGSSTHWGAANVVASDDGYRLVPAKFPTALVSLTSAAVFLLSAGLGFAVFRVGNASPLEAVIFPAFGLMTVTAMLVLSTLVYRQNRRRGDFLVADFRKNELHLPRHKRAVPLDRLVRFEFVQLYRRETRRKYLYSELQAVLSDDNTAEDRVLIATSSEIANLAQPLANCARVPVLSVRQAWFDQTIQVSRVEPK
jgi:hypothetical protein